MHYQRICGARLQPVLDSLQLMKSLGIWVEVTTLVIPTLNDSEEELRQIAEFILSLGPETPWHISQFHPTYQLTHLPPTPVESLRRGREIGLEVGLRYVYTGNIPGDEGENTFCYNCGQRLIHRHGYSILENQLEEANRELKRLATIDDLTGISNHRRFVEFFDVEWRRAVRDTKPISMILIDVDFFKQVNDTYGHFIGDEVLYHLAILLNKHTRIVDEVGRWGGEEFMIVCPGTSLVNVLYLAEKLRNAVEKYDFPNIGHLTVSMGVEVFKSEQSLQEMLEHADHYLYQAKNAGRNCVMGEQGRLI